MLKESYHVVLPVLDGHADSDTPFTTIENNARELISYIDENFNGTVLAIGGLSLGGQILIEMLSQRRDICKYAVIESALAVPMPLTVALIAPTANVTILVGGKEQKIMRQSAEILHTTIPDSKMQILNRYYHGELSLNHPDEYVKLLTRLVSTL